MGAEAGPGPSAGAVAEDRPKRESIRKRLQSGRQAARQSAEIEAAAVAAAAVAAAAAAEVAAVTAAIAPVRPASGAGGQRSAPASVPRQQPPPPSMPPPPMPSTTPLKLKARAAPTLQVRTTPGPEGIRGSGDAVTPRDTSNEAEQMSVSPAVAKAASKWMSKVHGSKAEEARNRLRRHRRSTSLGNDDELERGGDDVGASAASVAASNASAADAMRAAAAAAADRLGSVRGISKPRASVSGRLAQPSAAQVAAKAAYEAAEAEREASGAPAVPVVHGLDEAEMVLRMGSLASADQLSSARAAVSRMSELLDACLLTSRRLRCEPQNVYGYLLARVGQPTDAVSAAIPLEQALGAEKVREMVQVTMELRNLLRIKAWRFLSTSTRPTLHVLLLLRASV